MNIRVQMNNYENCRALGVLLLGSVHVMDIEEYLTYVVPSEMSVGSFPAGALKAQAIAARSYAMYHMNKNAGTAFDVTDGSADYQSMHVSQKHPTSDQVVSDTGGQILIYGGAAAMCCFCHANDGTQKAAHKVWGGNAISYLPEQVDQWTRNSGQPGHGHGVGMSQEGAKWAANNSKTHQQILAFYYPGTTLAHNYNGGGSNPGTSFPTDVNQGSKRVGYIATQNDPLTIRSGPGTNYGGIWSAAKGSTVDYYTTSSSVAWYYVVQGSRRGYGSATYILPSGGGSGNATWATRYGNNTFVQSNSYSGNVERWQTDVNKWYDAQSPKPSGVSRLTVDGKYGPASMAMCKAFQRAINASQTGYASPADKPALFNQYGQ